jgi:hypothetical protein
MIFWGHLVLLSCCFRACWLCLLSSCWHSCHVLLLLLTTLLALPFCTIVDTCVVFLHCRCLRYFFALLLLFVLCSHIGMLFALFSHTTIVTCYLHYLLALPLLFTLLFWSSITWVIVATIVVVVFLVLPFHIVTLFMPFLSHYSSHTIAFLTLSLFLCFFSRAVILLSLFFSHCHFYCTFFSHCHFYHVVFLTLSFLLR